ncbi:MAG: hypothetical protein WKF31_04365 [Thermoleophilaceae bacterium]
MGSDMGTSTLVQHIAARYLTGDSHDRQLRDTIPVYRDRRDALLEALERHLPGEYRAQRPVGGHHVWVTLTRPLDERALYSEALRYGVTFTPGAATLAEPRSGNRAPALVRPARAGAAGRGGQEVGPGDAECPPAGAGGGGHGAGVVGQAGASGGRLSGRP